MRHLLLILVLLPSLAFGADHYVRDGGSGNGSAWNNAWDVLPSTLTRGDTYYIADGTYASYDFDTGTSGSTLIYVKKATESEHGTETGWDSEYGNGQALFQSSGIVWTFDTAYWEVDGVVGSGKVGSSYGFGVNVTGTGNSTRGIRILAGNLTIKYADIYSDSPCSVADGDKQDGIYSTASVSNITIANNFIHEWKRTAILLSSTSNVVIENNYIYHTYSTSGAHGQAIQLGPGAVNGFDIRYNVFEATHGTGVIVYLDATHNDIDTYGNLFWESEDSAACGIFSTSQAIGNTGGDTTNNCDIYNNTFIGMNGRGPTPSGEIDHSDSGSNNYVYNNIWFDSLYGSMSDAGITEYDYNASDVQLDEDNDVLIEDSSVFANYGGGNFSLVSAIAGTTLSAPFATDITGIERGIDGVFDSGAWEFDSGAEETPSSVLGGGSFGGGSY